MSATSPTSTLATALARFDTAELELPAAVRDLLTTYAESKLPRAS